MKKLIAILLFALALFAPQPQTPYAVNAKIPSPITRRWALLITTSTSTIDGAAVGTLMGETIGGGNCNTMQSPFTGSPALATPYSQCAQSSAGGVAGMNGQPNWPTGSNLLMTQKAGISQNTSIRFRAGFGDAGNLGSWLGADTLTTSNYAAFRFSTSASDAHFKCETGDGAAVTVGDSGITPVVNTLYLLTVQFNDAVPNVVFSINGTVVCTNTTHLPTASTSLRYFSGISPITAVSTTELLSWIYIESDN
jgi:hypothetical protein